jgi:hypothetical protein
LLGCDTLMALTVIGAIRSSCVPDVYPSRSKYQYCLFEYWCRLAGPRRARDEIELELSMGDGLPLESVGGQ